MSKLVTVEVQQDLNSLNSTLREYAARRKQSAFDVLHKKGLDLSIQLYRAYAALTPAPGKITRDAEGRGWRVNVRRKAMEAAERLLGDDKSARFLVSRLPDGRMKVARQSGKVVSKRTLKKLGIGGKTVRQLKGRVNVRMLNARALSTLLELNYRERGRKVLGVSWLYRRWGRLKGGGPNATNVLLNESPRSKVLMGSATLATRNVRGGGSVGVLRLWAATEGVATVGQRTGVVRVAINRVIADTRKYLLRKEGEDLRAALKRRLQNKGISA